MTKRIIGIIGGTGLTRLSGPNIINHHDVNTALGRPSSALVEGEWAGKSVMFLARHGHPHAVPPHKVNYRANLLALKEAGCTEILAVNAVGGIHPEMGAGVISIPHQLIDFTSGRENTFFDGEHLPLEHIDFTSPFDAGLREVLIQSCQAKEVVHTDFAVVAVTQGPRLETAAEVDFLERAGCDLVGMTSMPEAVLARELGLPYASICLVVNPAAGRSVEEITMADIEAVLASGMDRVKDVLEETIRRL